jgi:ankyrin repeat protein
MYLIKRIIQLYTLIFILGLIYISYKVSSTPNIDVILLQVATTISKNNSRNRLNNTKQWLAQKKLKYLGFGKKCYLKSPKEEINGPAILSVLAHSTGGAEQVDKNISLELIRDFHKLGCSVNDQRKSGITPLQSAIIFGQIEFVELLIELGADIDLVVTGLNKTNGMNAIELTRYLITINKEKQLGEIPINTYMTILTILMKKKMELANSK